MSLCFLQFTGMYETIIEAIKTALEERLLHAGAATSQVLTALLLMVKVSRHVSRITILRLRVKFCLRIQALRVLDPSGIVLQRTFGPVKDFMCQRKDAASCVIQALTDSEGEHEVSKLMLSHKPKRKRQKS
eukprot:gb/GECG01003741.1/.p1 GENE.gb/GECG01003741.1/~~gb/GECG01003741.1/.p1  ORF type:complete len:131 (+),score=7.88 gb/GECG01003741.1/:1-393(+)